MRVSRRHSLCLLRGAALSALPDLAAADTYPSRPVRLVLPFPPGGVFDIVGRPWADKVKTNLGTVFVDNQPGAEIGNLPLAASPAGAAVSTRRRLRHCRPSVGGQGEDKPRDGVCR